MEPPTCATDSMLGAGAGDDQQARVSPQPCAVYSVTHRQSLTSSCVQAFEECDSTMHSECWVTFSHTHLTALTSPVSGTALGVLSAACLLIHACLSHVVHLNASGSAAQVLSAVQPVCATVCPAAASQPAER